MRRALKLLLLLGIGLAFARPGGGDPDSTTPGNGNTGDQQRPPEKFGDMDVSAEGTESASRTVQKRAEQGRGDVASEMDDAWSQHEQANEDQPARAPEGESEEFGNYTPGTDEWNDSGHSLDEQVQLVAQHADSDNPTSGRPNRDQIEEVLRNGTPVKLDGQNAVEVRYNGVKVIINYDVPARSTTYFIGG